MYYKPDIEYLKTTSLTLDEARKLRKEAGDRPLLVFAPTKYVEQTELDNLRISFCQLPFEIYKLKVNYVELKEYQKKVVNRLSEYLQSLDSNQTKYNRLLEVEPDLASEFNYPKKAWNEIGLSNYKSAENNLGEFHQTYSLKYQRGAVKHYLLVHAVDLINKLYLKSRTAWCSGLYRPVRFIAKH